MDLVTYITPDCPFCHLNEHFKLPAADVAKLQAGEPVQDVFPERPRSEREQIRTGIHPSCWEEEFGTSQD